MKPTLRTYFKDALLILDKKDNYKVKIRELGRVFRGRIDNYQFFGPSDLSVNTFFTAEDRRTVEKFAQGASLPSGVCFNFVAPYHSLYSEQTTGVISGLAERLKLTVTSPNTESVPSIQRLIEIKKDLVEKGDLEIVLESSGFTVWFDNCNIGFMVLEGLNPELEKTRWELSRADIIFNELYFGKISSAREKRGFDKARRYITSGDPRFIKSRKSQ